MNTETEIAIPSKEQVNTVADLIVALGGTEEVKRRLMMPHNSTVSEWKRKNTLPVKHWHPLMEIAREIGIDWLDAEKMLAIVTNGAGDS